MRSTAILSPGAGLRFLFTRAAKLFSGHVIAAAIGLASLSLVARTLGPEGMGILVLIVAYAAIADRLINFQSQQAIIRYGVAAHDRGAIKGFGKLIRFGLGLDFSTALVATALAFAFAPIIAGWLGWTEPVATLLQLYSLTILSHIRGTPMAVLQIYDKYGIVARIEVLNAIFRLIGCIILFFGGGGIAFAVLVYALSSVLGSFLLIYAAANQLVGRGIAIFERIQIRGLSAEFPGIWAYVWTTNLNSSIRMTSREVDVFVVEVVLGTVAVGLYRIAKQVASVVERLIAPLYKVIYPMLAAHVAKGEFAELRRLSSYSAAGLATIAALIWLSIFLGGTDLLKILFGNEFVGAYSVLVWYILALVVAAASFPLQPIMLSFGRPQLTFWVHLVSTVIYFFSLYNLMVWHELAGAGVAYLIYYGFWSVTMFVLISRRMRRERHA